MKAIILMFDSLNRHWLTPYAEQQATQLNEVVNQHRIETPHFARLAQKADTFDRFYAGSMPCMPARRELHTGRYNFLHRSWGPLEPFDPSMPEQLSRAGIHTHLVSDHPHYWEDGGATYHTRYTTWQFERGQEGDPWQAEVADEVAGKAFRQQLKRQDKVNRRWMQEEQLHSQMRTMHAGLDFIERNATSDNWLLQIELFDPHEPFFAPARHRAAQGLATDAGNDWPGYSKVVEAEEEVSELRRSYAALLTLCDESVGRLLDSMDRLNLWQDTLLIVNTDHGYLLGEHGWWAKRMMPWYNELVNIPMFLWDPRAPSGATRRQELARTIDIAPTILAWFEQPIPPETLGHDLAKKEPAEEYSPGALFGAHGGHVNVTDGRYVYMRAPVRADNTPLEEYTLMPTHMRSRFTPTELRQWQQSPPFRFSRGVPLIKIDVADAMPWPRSAIGSGWQHGPLLFDLHSDPGQQHPLENDPVELDMIVLLIRLMHEAEAPLSQFERLGLPFEGEPGEQHLQIRAQAARAEANQERLPDLAGLPGQAWLQAPLVRLLSWPPSHSLLDQQVPDLTRTEVINLSPTLSLVDLASCGALTANEVRTLAAALDTLPSPAVIPS